MWSYEITETFINFHCVCKFKEIMVELYFTVLDLTFLASSVLVSKIGIARDISNAHLKGGRAVKNNKK